LNHPSAPDSWLRDDLARVRTKLANERTFLAYIRTALALWAGGAAAVQFLPGFRGAGLAAALSAAGAATLGTGLHRFLKTSTRLKRDANAAGLPD